MAVFAALAALVLLPSLARPQAPGDGATPAGARRGEPEDGPAGGSGSPGQATVEVTVGIRDGGALQLFGLALRPVQTDLPPDRYRRTAETDLDGVAIFEKVPPGEYRIELDPLPDPRLVRPSDNPFVPPPRLTVLPDDRRLAARVDLWRGTEVRSEIRRSHGLAAVTVRYREVDHGFLLESRLAPSTAHDVRALVPGRWVVSIEPETGYDLVELSEEGAVLAEGRARLELLENGKSVFLRWLLAGPGYVWGYLTGDGAERVGIVARLIEPGPNTLKARALGATPPVEVNARIQLPDRQGRRLYELFLPDGRWLLAPVSSGAVESEPGPIEIELGTGSTERADFLIRQVEQKGGAGPGRRDQLEEEGLYVTVEARPDPDNPRGWRRSLDDAVVEVFRRGEERGGTPIATAATREYRPAYFRGLPVGDYVVVAGHRRHAEAWADATGRGSVTVRLARGASLRLEARDQVGAPAPRVVVEADRLEPAGDLPRLATPPARTELTDQTGRVRLAGLGPGRWRIRARPEDRAMAALVRLSAGGRSADGQIEIEIRGEEEVALTARLLPGLLLRGRLACSDGGPLPPTVALRIEDRAGAVVLEAGDVLLSGRLADGIAAGPVGRGYYRLAIRPSGFDEWTTAAEGEALEVSEAGDTDLGVIDLECDPTIRIVPRIVSGQPCPDLRQAWIVARVVVKGEVRDLKPVAEPTRLVFRRLPADELRFEASLSHPFFLPAKPQALARDLGLQRGRVVTLAPEVTAIGGGAAVALAGGWTRTRREDGWASPACRARADGRAWIPSLPPGSHLLDLCAEGCCLDGVCLPVPLGIEPYRWTRWPAGD